MTASRRRTIRWIFGIVLLGAVAVQLGVYFALRSSGASGASEPAESETAAVGGGGTAEGKAVGVGLEAAESPAQPATGALEPALERASEAARTPSGDTGNSSGANMLGPEAGGDPALDAETPEVPSTGPPAKQAAQRASTRRKPARRSTKSKRTQARVKPTAPSPPLTSPSAPKVGRVTFKTRPDKAQLALDGVFIGNAPLSNIAVSPGPHRLAVSAPGYQPETRKFRVVAGRESTESISLSKTPAPAVAAAAEPSRPSPSKPAKARQAPRPATPRVAGGSSGSRSRGKSAVRSRCNTCHRARGRSSVSARRYTRSQWDRFFARGIHDRYERLGGLVTRSELAAIKAYLKASAADVPCSQAAGERCK